MLNFYLVRQLGILLFSPADVKGNLLLITGHIFVPLDLSKWRSTSVRQAGSKHDYM